MKEIINKIKMLIQCHKRGIPYNVKLTDIVIPEEFRNTHPRFKKMVAKREYYRKYGTYSSKIILNRDFVLIDGYTTYLLCVENGEEYVDAYFVD